MKNCKTKRHSCLTQLRKKTLLFAAVFCFVQLLIAEPNESVYHKILEKLPLCRDSKIGAIDAGGSYTKNSGKGFNCAGFAKWIVDGFYAPMAKNGEKKYISLSAVRKKHIGRRGCTYTLIYEQSRDPYFGLDWTRNLAMELGSRRGESCSYNEYDVTCSDVCEYIKDCGYPLDRLEEIIKERSKINSDKIYLGSINGFFGENPKLWQHYHVAVFIPYYKDGELRIAVLERNKETSFEYLQKRYSNTFCHLVAIENCGKFELMTP